MQSEKSKWYTTFSWDFYHHTIAAYSALQKANTFLKKHNLNKKEAATSDTEKQCKRKGCN